MGKLFHCLLNNHLLSLDNNNKYPLFIMLSFRVLEGIINGQCDQHLFVPPCPEEKHKIGKDAKYRHQSTLKKREQTEMNVTGMTFHFVWQRSYSTDPLYSVPHDPSQQRFWGWKVSTLPLWSPSSPALCSWVTESILRAPQQKFLSLLSRPWKITDITVIYWERYLLKTYLLG